LHVEIDARPPVFDDDLALRLVGPDEDWRQRPDMDPEFTRAMRAGMASRARFIEELVTEQAGKGVAQYVILGAGLDTFAQRRPEIAAGIRVFEVDQPGAQAWKRQRLVELGFGIPEWLRLVPVDFEAGASWWEQLVAAGFDPSRPAVVASTGVSMYLTKDAIAATLRQVAALAPGSTLAMTFILPAEFAEPAEREQQLAVERAARASGTPFRSLFSPSEILSLAREAGFHQVQHVSSAELAERYFAGRTDDLRPGDAEAFLVATTG
jgi:methyltransferase (TIGR00027 family)